jgi:hypothetical protein
MGLDWRHLADRFPNAVQIQLETYAPTLDAVERAVEETLQSHCKTEYICPFGWGDPRVENGRVVGVEHRPIAPVHSNDASMVLVGALQLWVLVNHQAFSPGAQPSGVGATYVLLAMIDRLVKRNLALTPSTAADLVRFALPPPWASHLDSYDLYLFPILRLIAKSFTHPFPKVLNTALRALFNELSTILDVVVKRKTSRGLTPGRMRKARDQVAALLEITPEN